ncbi:glyoxylase-like metal-dependent hydrolase (beta-lactamase superfamily II) [Brevibacterium paucivorans]|uniref:Glyoxylase-like metal-dependent hydrolase (Beta-lactamase superfamily II) n=1 Tax=Brevibacterium paucivorans TaxID=170994 RepID=A0ABS2SM96_9MICO|nr:MBL fold metallo-hydrolase [Brevibacterium paucivorans]MBM7817381.1 glyoxylase-like metal-dependent hydrolase (beta-lactamase superfamily II) [Brevibacterium paucivorans]
MFVLSSVAEFLGVNCYAVAREGASECVLFDAGLNGAPELHELLKEEGLTPVALVLTHGHPDHILGLPHFYEEFGVLPTYLHSDDVYRVERPADTMNPQFKAMLAPLVAQWEVPQVQRYEDGDVLQLAGLDIRIVHTPGHTEGSCVFEVTEGSESLLFTGDVLFAGSIGRVDLPGGDPEAMQRSLEIVKGLANQPVYPGHGPATRLDHEKRVNPFL